MKNIDPLNQLFNLTPFTEQKQENLPVVSNEAAQTSGEEQEDIDLVRNTLRNLLATGTDAVENLSDIARSSEAARTYEVLGSLIKNMSEVSKDLLEMHKTKKEIIAPKEDTGMPGTAINNQYNVVFTGTTSDILKKLRDNRTVDE